MARSPFQRRRAGRIFLFAFATLLAACDLPRDPAGTLGRARGGVLRVGAVDAPPWLLRTPAGAMGPEADLVRAFARSIDADVDWRWGALDDHLVALERFELDVVAGGLTAESPWSRRVAFTRPWHEPEGRKGVLAVAPGENRTLVELERVIESPGGGRP